jgi:integrase/recombinase XerD
MSPSRQSADSRETRFADRQICKTALAGSTRRLTLDAVYRLVRSCSAALGFEIGVHTLHAMAAANVLDHQPNIATARIYDHRKIRPEDRPTFKVNY